MFQPSNRQDQAGNRAVASDVSQRQRTGVSGVQFDDRRPPPTLPGLIRQCVIQRMAVMTVDDLGSQEDPLVWNNLNHAESQATGPVGDLKTNKVWDRLDDNEEIRLVEHGEVRQIGQVNASRIASSMFSTPKKIPDKKAIGGITFQSCYAGIKGGGGSLVSDMADELKKKGRSGVRVTGRTGIAFGFKGMGEETAETDTTPYVWTNPLGQTAFNRHPASTDSHAGEKGFQAYFDAMWELKDEKTKTTNQDIFQHPFTYSKPWEMLNISQSAWGKMTPENRAAQVADEMADYWQKLKDSMDKKGGFKPQKTAVISEVSQKKSLCFLTTACTEAKGLPDHCRELTVLRAFRDGYMSSLEAGPSLIGEYYAVAPRIVTRIKASRGSDQVFEALYDKIATCVALIERGDNHKALSIYRRMVLDLKGKWM